MNLKQLVSEVLCLPPSAIDYHVSERLANHYAGKAIIEGNSYLFDLEDYVKAKLCTLETKTIIHNQFVTYWDREDGLQEYANNVWYGVRWQDYGLEVLILHFNEGYHYWIIADIREIAETFLVAVSEWNAEVRGEVLVFDNGGWQKDEDLFKAIKSSTFENLTLPASLKNELQKDLARFFAARETYAKYKLPWKRGVLLVGPPGNGKTHAVKALVNLLGKPCLYVKSFRNSHGPTERSMRSVFEMARKSAPCVLIMEDLDSLITNDNRSYFLNELDGFAVNSGILTLATTNYPEKLDSAIIDRPSRFDRKYHFTLPAFEERLTYIKSWNGELEPSMHLSESGAAKIAELSENFSFAYLKELFVSSMMRWIEGEEQITMDQAMLEQVEMLHTQMRSTKTEAKTAKSKELEED